MNMSEPEHSAITVIELEKMNLLGLMLGSLLGRRLGDRNARRHFEALSGLVEVEAGAMRVALSFGRGGLEIRRGAAAGRPAARIRGTLVAVLDAALGRGLLRHVLRGELSARGRPLVLWHLLALMRVPKLPDSSAERGGRHGSPE
jgi:hypothetical protein